MFRGIFGTKSDRPPPPKNQIEVVCPACGAAQFEPRLVVSTLCKKCGVHLSIEKKKVTASSNRQGSAQPWKKAKSGAPPAEGAEKQVTPPPPAGDVKKEIPAPGINPEPARKPGAESKPPSPTGSESLVTGELVGFGDFLRQQATAAKSTPKTAAPTAAPVSEPPSAAPAVAPEAELPAEVTPSPVSAQPAAPAGGGPEGLHAESRKRPHAPAPTPAPAPMSAGALQKMKDQGIYRHQYFKDAECFECGHRFKVSRSSRSAECPQCGARIAMEDVEINMESVQPIKTRGDVLIRKRGHLTTHTIQCRDLRCYGQLDANVNASGDAVFRTTGTVSGEVRCHRFVVERDADVSFANPIHADQVEIQARITGTIIANGPVLIGSSGSVNGDVTARSVSIEPGGELNGGMNIVRSQPTAAK